MIITKMINYERKKDLKTLKPNVPKQAQFFFCQELSSSLSLWGIEGREHAGKDMII